MKLAEALLSRGDMQKKIAALKERINRNVLVQEGSAPHEDAGNLLHEGFATIKELESLMTAINQTNLSCRLPDGRSLTQAIAHRDALQEKHALIQGAITAAHREPDRYSVREIKWTSAIDVSALQKQLEDVAGQLRQLNAQIQETNWKVDLVAK